MMGSEVMSREIWEDPINAFSLLDCSVVFLSRTESQAGDLRVCLFIWS